MNRENEGEGLGFFRHLFWDEAHRDVECYGVILGEGFRVLVISDGRNHRG